MAAAALRTHRALRTDDVLACVFSRLALHEGCVSVASVSKQWRTAWRLHAKGLYRPVRLGIGEFDYGDHITALADGSGVVVPDFNGHCLHLYSSEGERLYSSEGGVASQWALNTPVAVAVDGEGVAWVVEHDDCQLRKARIDWETMEADESWTVAPPIVNFDQPIDLAISGDAVLVLCRVGGRSGHVFVLDRESGNTRYAFGSSAAPGGVDELRCPSSLVVDGDYCFVAETYNQSIVVFNWREGTFVRRYGKTGDAPDMGGEFDGAYWDNIGPYDDDRKSTEPGQFNEPFGLAIRNKMLYVSEKGGRRIQILRLPDLLSGADPEVVQIIPSPGGVELAGLCLDGDRLWCIGPPTPAVSGGGEAAGAYHSSISIFAPIFKVVTTKY